MEFPELYAPGIVLPITSHRPPEPFGKRGYKHFDTPGVTDIISAETVGHLSHDELTFAHHPRERHEPSIVPMPGWFVDGQTINLKIVCPISTGSYGAQVVLCELVKAPADVWKNMGHAHTKTVVAKIFDPLHYYGCPDMVYEADREYAQEAAAYMHLHGQRRHKTYTAKPHLVPRFYGTWSTDITRDHLRKSFMAPTNRAILKDKEDRERAAAAASKAASNPSQPAKLKPYPFRPVRIILTEHIKGFSLSYYLFKTTDSVGNEIVKPRAEFDSQELRLDIFGSILDTVTRLEHLGVMLPTIPGRAPSVFIITKTANAKKEVKYGVVMTDLSQADVACYTDIGYDLSEKLPRPAYPQSIEHDIGDYLTLRGWYPEHWADDPTDYDSWGDSHFRDSDYSDSGTINKIAQEVGWTKDLIKFGRVPPETNSPEWREMMDRFHADTPDEWKTYRMPPAEEYYAQMEQSRQMMERARIEEEEALRQQRAELARLVERQQAAQAAQAAGKKAMPPPPPPSAAASRVGELRDIGQRQSSITGSVSSRATQTSSAFDRSSANASSSGQAEQEGGEGK